MFFPERAASDVEQEIREYLVHGSDDAAWARDGALYDLRHSLLGCQP